MLGSKQGSFLRAQALPAVTGHAAPTELECDSLGGPARGMHRGHSFEIAEL